MHRYNVAPRSYDMNYRDDYDEAGENICNIDIMMQHVNEMDD